MANADASVEKARNKATKAQIAEREARADANTADSAYDQARDALTDIKEKAAHHSSRISALIETAGAINADLEEAEARAVETRQSLAELPNTDAAQSKITTLRADLAERRAVQVESQSAFDSLVRAAEERRRRLGSIERELANWRGRHKSAGDQINQLSERQTVETAEICVSAPCPKK